MTTTEEDLKKKPHRLKDLTVTAIAAVDRGANPGAHVVLMKRDSNGKPMTRTEIMKQIETYATRKHPTLTKAAAIAAVAGEPEVREAYRSAEYAPFTEDKPVAKASREEAMLESKTARELIERIRRIRKQSAMSLADLAVTRLMEYAKNRQRQNPKLSDAAALVLVISEGLGSGDLTSPIRFLTDLLADEKNALLLASDALKLDSIREQFSSYGISIAV